MLTKTILDMTICKVKDVAIYVDAIFSTDYWRDSIFFNISAIIKEVVPKGALEG